MEIYQIITLSLSSLLLIFVGASRLINPIQAYLKNSGIKLNQDHDLLNEMRGVSALMLSGGILILLGIFIPSLMLNSHVIGALMFLGFAIGRFISIAVDGKPNKQIIQGIVFEVIFGGANVIGLLL
jgi:hypothetical protein